MPGKNIDVRTGINVETGNRRPDVGEVTRPDIEIPVEPIAPQAPPVQAPTAPAAQAPQPAPRPSRVEMQSKPAAQPVAPAPQPAPVAPAEAPPRAAVPPVVRGETPQPEFSLQAARDALAAVPMEERAGHRPVDQPGATYIPGGTAAIASVAQPVEVVQAAPEPAPTTTPAPRVAAAPKPAPAAAAPEVAPDVKAAPAPPETALIPPAPKSAPRVPLPTTRFPASAQADVDKAQNAMGNLSTGTAIKAAITGDPSLGYIDVSAPAELLFRAYQNPTSGLRELFAQDPGIDERLMADPNYAIPRMMEFLANSYTDCYTSKDPTVGEASVEKRRLLAHLGSLFIKLNPQVAAQYNADFDGDEMKISLDKEAIAGARSALDFLIDMAGAVKIDAEFAGFGSLWGRDVAEVKEILRGIFITKTGFPIVLSERGLDGMAKALMAQASGDKEGFRSLMMWVRSEGTSFGPETADIMTDQILQRIYKHNMMIRMMEQALAGLADWNSENMPQASNTRTPPFTSTLPPFPNLIKAPGLAANDLDVSMMRGESIGAIEGRNPPFRRIADAVREGKKRPDLFGNPLSADTTVSFADVYATILNGIDHLDESVRRVAGEARRIVMLEIGRPDYSSPEAFQEWLVRFSDFYNHVVLTYNSIAARMKFDMTLMPYDDLSLPTIPDIKTAEGRRVMAAQFLKVYGGVKMSVLFGNHRLLRGCKNLTLNEFKDTHNLPSTGNPEMKFEGPDAVANFIMRLADLHTSFARDFRTSLLSEDGATGGLRDMMMKDNPKQTKLYDMAVRRKKLADSTTEFDKLVARLKVGKVAAFTGHRPQSLKGVTEDHVRAGLTAAIERAYEHGYRTFITGMALGVDTWAAEILTEMKATHPGIVIIGAVPGSWQTDKGWSSAQKANYRKVLAALDGYDVAPGEYAVSKLMDRNRAMVDNADLLIAVYNGAKGGTSNAFNYAQSQGKAILRYNPDTDERTVIAGDGRAITKPSPIALDSDVNLLATAMYTLSPELFEFAGLTSAEAFATDELGLKMTTANSAEKLGGVLYEGQARYRFAPILRYEALLAGAKTGAQRAKYEGKRDRAMESLASSSPTWATLVNLYRDGLDIFPMLSSDRTMSQKDQDIWEFVTDPRNSVGRPTMEPYEVASELFAHPKGKWATSRFTGDLGHKALRANIRQASWTATDLFASSSYDTCVEQATTALAEHSEPGEITAFLDSIKADSRVQAPVDVAFLADAALSILESSQRSAEKPKQEDEVSYLYSAVCYAINGAVLSDLETGGDLALGGVAQDRFQERPMWLARMLADKDFSITVYDGSKDRLINRAALFDGNPDPTEPEIRAWLMAHPRAAMALRRHGMRNSVDSNGFSNPTATASLSDSISQIAAEKNGEHYVHDLVMREMMDHPGFYAMVTLATQITGNMRSQLRQPTIDHFYDVIDLIRGLSTNDDSAADTLAYVRAIALATFGAKKMAKIDETYKKGQEQEADGVPRETAPAGDVRATEEYHLAELIRSLAVDLDRYARLVSDMKDVLPLDEMPAAEAAKLFRFEDDGATRSYVSNKARIDSAKTNISTSVNGMESVRNGALMTLASYVAPRCDAPDPPVIDTVTFRRDWRKLKLAGRKVTVDAATDYYIAVSEVTIDELVDLFPGGVPVEVTGNCTAPVPCIRCSTADPSTNLTGHQTPALARFLAIVRTESTEGLNLQGKKKGTDGLDSVSKNRAYKIIELGAQVESEVERVFNTEGMAAARTWLAKELDRTYRGMLYADQMSIADYTNVAQYLIRAVETATGPRIKVLQVGQLNSIVEESQRKAWAQSKNGLDDAAQTKAALDGYLAMGAGGDLDIEAMLAGIKVAGQTRGDGIESGIPARRAASMGRNAVLMAQILAEHPEIRAHSDKELDVWEAELRNNPASADVFDRWPKYLLDKPGFKWFAGKTRYHYRLVGGIGATGNSFGHKAAGFRNAWVIDVRNPRAAEMISMAYGLGLTTLLEGELAPAEADALWKNVYQQTGVIDANQVVNIPVNPGESPRGMLPMFFIKLNGGNTTIDNGALKAGVVYYPGDNVKFFYENPLNELHLNDGEMGACQSYVENTFVNITGDYHMPARIAFADMFEGIGTPAQADQDVRGFFLEYRWLSNFWGADGKGEAPLSIELDGVTYPSVENAYQAAKTLDLAERVQFEACTAYDAKQLGKTVKKQPGWDRIKFGVMGKLVRQKFAPGTELAAMLLATGDGYLEERTKWPNPIWGVGGPDAVGENRLGHGLMTVRDELRPPGWTPTVLGRDEVEVRVATMDEYLTYIIDPYVKDTTPDAPDEFDRLIPIDTGTDRPEGSKADLELREGVRRFASRLHEVGPNGLLPTARPGEIIGFLIARNGNDVRLHPIRPYEPDNASGAPASIEIDSVRYNTDTEELVLNWAHTGTMLGRAFKFLESGRAANKVIARDIAYPDVPMKDGTLMAGQVHQLSTISRRLDERMKDKMEAAMFKARLDPWGYNLAEHPGSLPNNPELKVGLLDSTAELSDWKALLDPKADGSYDGEIDFFPKSMADMNAFCNNIAVKAIRYGINPTVVFASRHNQDGVEGVPSKAWYEFRILFSDGPVFLESFMNFFHLLMPKFMPEQNYSTTGVFTDGDKDTFFNKDLQVLVPFTYVDEDGHTVTGEHWVDMFGGPHFPDEHFSGYLGAGTTVRPDGLASINTLKGAGRKLSPYRASLYAGWSGITNGFRAESASED